MSGGDLVVGYQFVLMDTARSLVDLDVASFLKGFGPTPDGPDMNVAVLSQASLRDGNPGRLPGIGNQDVPEGARAYFERLVP